MKIMMVSDIHGDVNKVELIINLFQKYQCDKLIILGDLCHNGWTFRYQDQRTIGHLLSLIVDKLILIRGNCDRNTDDKYLPIGFREHYQFTFNKYQVFCHHGHKSAPKLSAALPTIYAQGHTHRGQIKQQDNQIFINPGSIAYPRSSEESYLIMSDEGIYLYNLENNIIEELQFGVLQ